MENKISIYNIISAVGVAACMVALFLGFVLSGTDYLLSGVLCVIIAGVLTMFIYGAIRYRKSSFRTLSRTLKECFCVTSFILISAVSIYFESKIISVDKMHDCINNELQDCRGYLESFIQYENTRIDSMCDSINMALNFSRSSDLVDWLNEQNITYDYDCTAFKEKWERKANQIELNGIQYKLSFDNELSMLDSLATESSWLMIPELSVRTAKLAKEIKVRCKEFEEQSALSKNIKKQEDVFCLENAPIFKKRLDISTTPLTEYIDYLPFVLLHLIMLISYLRSFIRERDNYEIESIKL